MAYPTNPIYKLYKDPITNQVIAVFRTRNSMEVAIPLDEANTDYQTYLAWVAEGNTAEAAD